MPPNLLNTQTCHLRCEDVGTLLQEPTGLSTKVILQLVGYSSVPTTQHLTLVSQLLSFRRADDVKNKWGGRC